MNIQQIKAIARDKGIKAGTMKKPELIRTIQRAEGNFDCYGSAVSGLCDQPDCRWREDCLETSVAR
ncbi:MAG: SAP domain-containing protein [Alphaproteobacteria bacterium]|uniref:SAP domain-containing protein n=1 Tax=Candidatus Nitrobium versatile TaxID=2884831 RepID=A0A953J618_9BACT|nr:SAP domain-containing protein [Candidatus Nitrobium versatile]